MQVSGQYWDQVPGKEKIRVGGKNFSVRSYIGLARRWSQPAGQPAPENAERLGISKDREKETHKLPGKEGLGSRQES